MNWRMGLDLARLALLNVRRRPLRSGLTVVGVAIGVTTVVGLLGLSGGVQRAVEGQLARLGPDLVLLLPATLPTPGAAPSTSKAAFPLDLGKLSGLPEAAEVGALLRRTLPVRAQSVQGFFTVIGVAPRVEAFARFVSRFELARGRFPQAHSELLLTQAAARDLQLDLGDTLEVAGKAFTVGGVLQPTGDPNVEGAIFLQLEALWELSDAHARGVSLAWARARELRRVEALARAVEALIAEQGLAGQVLVQTAQRALEVVRGVLGALRAAFTALAAIALLVGGVGLANTMYTAVVERRREIGVLMALGARPGQIAALYLLEAGLLGLLGGALGLIAGVGLAQSFALLLGRMLQAQAPAVSVGLDLTLLGVALGGAIGLGLVAGGWPAYRAAGLSPVDALRFE